MLKNWIGKQGIPSDLGKINQISKDIVDYQKIIVKLNLDKKKLKELSTGKRGSVSQKGIELKMMYLLIKCRGANVIWKIPLMDFLFLLNIKGEIRPILMLFEVKMIET
jgi:hypothetical protein